MSREEVAIVMSCLGHVIELILYPVLSRNLVYACPPVDIVMIFFREVLTPWIEGYRLDYHLLLYARCFAVFFCFMHPILFRKVRLAHLIRFRWAHLEPDCRKLYLDLSSRLLREAERLVQFVLGSVYVLVVASECQISIPSCHKVLTVSLWHRKLLSFKHLLSNHCSY